MPNIMNIVEAAALVGLGIIIENPEKRKVVIGTLDRLGTTVEKTVKDFLPKKGGAADVQGNSSIISNISKKLLSESTTESESE